MSKGGDKLQFESQTVTLPRERAPRLGAIVRVINSSTGTPSKPALRANAKEQVFRLTAEPCTIGSSNACDVVIDDPSVSRRHAELRLVENGVAVLDLESTNGTSFAGQRIERMVVVLGAHLQLGNAQIVIDVDAASVGTGVYESESYRGMIGASVPMRELFYTLARIEASRVNVLVTGESGVGKELVARALHEGSGVRGPLVTINCGAIAKELVAAELFGHKKGAYTGALDNRLGAFESADGGTLFLDEIGELPLDVQPNLLRAIEYGEVRPVGSDQSRKVDVRIIAATNRDLLRSVEEGTFREDLYYRLAVIKVEVPALRSRGDDVRILAAHFARLTGIAELPTEVVASLRGRSWAGNVRELRNAMQAFAVLGHLPNEPERGVRAQLEREEALNIEKPYAVLKDEVIERFHRAYFPQLLKKAAGNQSAAARISGLDRSYLGKLISRYGIKGRE